MIFDLDDTLFEELTFVIGGLNAVAEHASKKWDWPKHECLTELEKIIYQQGRGKVFDTWLELRGEFSQSRVKECVRIYRGHRPSIKLFDSAETTLRAIPPSIPTFIVTDGNKQVQANKVSALALWDRFTKVFITHRYGLTAAKPSTYCFEIIKNEWGFSWEQMVYIGDNPTKDFVSLKPLGMQTVRVRTGAFRDITVAPHMDAEFSIDRLEEILDLPLRAIA